MLESSKHQPIGSVPVKLLPDKGPQPQCTIILHTLIQATNQKLDKTKQQHIDRIHHALNSCINEIKWNVRIRESVRNRLKSNEIPSDVLFFVRIAPNKSNMNVGCLTISLNTWPDRTRLVSTHLRKHRAFLCRANVITIKVQHILTRNRHTNCKTEPPPCTPHRIAHRKSIIIQPSPFNSSTESIRRLDFCRDQFRSIYYEMRVNYISIRDRCWLGVVCRGLSWQGITCEFSSVRCAFSFGSNRQWTFWRAGSSHRSADRFDACSILAVQTLMRLSHCAHRTWI